ncbi:MAG: 4'-phosphopantetheinyl transferase superfamily protein [Deltaproteobacteria bacterium]|nr:4'-phosphopantetheinyl transferase superfamily protein [Deltaproteobacteria bacterium]
MDEARRLSSKLLPAGIAVQEDEPRAVATRLLPAEEPVIARAVAKRRMEYASGRTLARRALEGAGFEHAASFAILQDEQRAPLWPEGFTGSITHTVGRVAAAALSTSLFRGVGLDVEREAPLSEGVAKRVLTPEDEAMLARLRSADRAFAGKLVFSAKECAYKCQYALTQTYLGFDAMWVEVDLDASIFIAHFQREVGEFAEGATLEGRFARGEGLVMTAVAYA